MLMRTIAAAALALVTIDANAAAFSLANCSGAPISVYAYDGNDTILALPFNATAIVIAHDATGLVRCSGITCKVKVIYANGFHPNWANYVYAYDSCARSVSEAELTTFSNCMC